MTISETIHTTYDLLEIQHHIHLNNQTLYLVTQWSLEILRQPQIDSCTTAGFEINHIHPIDYTDGQPLYEVHWSPAWQLDSTTMDSESEPDALTTYKQRTQLQRRTKKKKHHQYIQSKWGGVEVE